MVTKVGLRALKIASIHFKIPAFRLSQYVLIKYLQNASNQTSVKCFTS